MNYNNQIGNTADVVLKIMKAAAINDKCFTHLLDFMKVGMTEKQIANEVEETFKKLGADGLAFPTIAASGVNSCLPHAEPTDKVIEEGDFLTLDIGPTYEGYCGDMTRTVAFSHVTDEMQKVYNIVLDAQLAGLEACKAGMLGHKLDQIVRDVIEDAGYGQYFIHGTGHCVGKEVHVPPWVSNRAEEDNELLLENHAVTIEPGIYIPDQFGVRIEDLAIVTNFGIINASASEKELIIL